MLDRRYVVYRITDLASSARLELRVFRGLGKAKSFATKYYQVTGCPVTIDYTEAEITRAGRRVTENDVADIWGLPGDEPSPIQPGYYCGRCGQYNARVCFNCGAAN